MFNKNTVMCASVSLWLYRSRKVIFVLNVTFLARAAI